MTGAGAASLAFAHEQSFLGSLVDADSDSTPDYYAFGRNPSITDLSLENQAQRLRDAGMVQSVESVKQNFEGAINIEAVISSDVHAEVEKLVFNDGGSGFKFGRPSFGRIFAGIDYIDGTAERALKGCIPVEYSINYEEGGMTTFSLNLLFADEDLATSITPSSVTQVSDGTSVPDHGVTITIDGGSGVSKLQSATLSISDISRFHRGASPTPEDAVIGPCTTTLDVEAIFTGPSRTELAYGATGSTTPQDSMTAVAGSVALDVDGTTLSTYTLPKLKPDSHSWNDVISADTDTTDQTTFNVDGQVTVA